MFTWLNTHRGVIGWLFGLSIVTFIVTLIAIPFLVINMSPSYFVDPLHEAASWRGRHPAIRAIARIAKNMVGTLFVLAGIAMLALPGQGILTMLIGILLLNFPGKRALELWIIRRRGVLQAINWIRRKSHHPPLELDQRDSDGG